MSEKLTENQIFMRDMAKMFCGCSFSGYVRCEEHKDVPLPEPTYTKADFEQLIEAIAVRVERLESHGTYLFAFGEVEVLRRKEVLATIRSTKL